jgi:hypothetical protein
LYIFIDLVNRGARRNRPVHVINVDIKDTHEHAVKGGQSIVEMCMQVANLILILCNISIKLFIRFQN